MQLPTCGLLLVLAGLASQGQAILNASEPGNRYEKVTVELPFFNVTGRSHRGIDTFNGIPYAEPPVGKLRLKPPKPLNRSMGTIEAIAMAPACPQMDIGKRLRRKIEKIGGMALGIPILKTLVGQEDCLTLTVQRPSNFNPEKLLPVMFYIHGGGFEHGSSNMYDASSLLSFAASEELPFVFVATNYRLGGFGFMPGREILRDGSANLGLMDQRLALQWVSENIKLFGGDRKKVTVWGHSAGAQSAFYQMALYGGGKNFTHKKRPLFRGAILNSGTMKNMLPVDHPKAQKIYNAVVKNTKCDVEPHANNTLACLRNLDFETFHKAVSAVPGHYDSINSGTHYSYAPRPDGNLLPNHTEGLIKTKKYFSLPLIVGEQEDEGTLFSLGRGRIESDDDFIRQAAVLFRNVSYQQIRELLSFYPNDTEGSPFRTGDQNIMYRNYKRYAAFLTDTQFTFPRRRFSDLMTGVNSGVGIYAYLASYFHGFPYLGTFHGSDITHVFYGIPPVHSAKCIRKYFINFLYGRHPNGHRHSGDGPLWNEYNDWADRRNHHKTMWFRSMFSNDEFIDMDNAHKLAAYTLWNTTEAFRLAPV